jgi:hypothetical protein
MKVKPAIKILLLAVALAVWACSDPEQVDSGGVVLQVEFVNSPFRIGVNDQDFVSIPTIEVDSIIPNTTAGTSDLMNVQLDLYEVTFARSDTGTRAPAPFVFKLTGVVPVSGNLTLTNYPVMSADQMRNPPLSDLLFENGGFDKETGSPVIRIDMTFTVFGRTLGGDDVASLPRRETFEFVPTAN